MNTNRIGRALVRTALVAVATLALAACFENSPVDELTPDGQGGIDIDGTWSGVVSATYYCEATPALVEFSISGDSVTVTDGSGLPVDLSGTITEQSPGRYSIAFENDGEQPGLLIFDAQGQYATFISDDSPVTGDRQGYVGLLQKESIRSVSYTESDLVGEWSGVAARVDDNYAITESYDISAAITAPDGLALSGQDDDGEFSAEIPAIVLETDFEQDTLPGLYVSGGGGANQVIWPDLGQTGAYNALYALSYDKEVLAIGFLTSLCSTNIFSDLPAQKFALLMREP
ncbi:MAG: hypothetical protein ACOCZB_08485 [Spirochaetota bacterium]